MDHPSRREFMTGLGAAAALGWARPIRAAQADITFGYAAITWGDRYEQAIADVAKAGYKGIQLRANVVPANQDDPPRLKALLDKQGLRMICLSSGDVALDVDAETEIGRHVAHARFVKALGGSFLQLLDNQPTKDPAEGARRVAELGHRMSEIGRRSAELGISVVYHNHMGSLSELPEGLDRVLEAAHPDHLRLLLDVAHYQQGGGDPAVALRKYARRLSLLHLKDVRPAPAGGPRPYQWVELGQGTVDLRGVFAALDGIGFHGWAVVELDEVPVTGRTELQSALISRRYLEETLSRRV